MRVVFTNININLKNECTFHVNVCFVIYPNYKLVMKQTCNLIQSESFRFHFFFSFFFCYNLLSYTETVTVDKSLTFIFFYRKFLIFETFFLQSVFYNFCFNRNEFIMFLHVPRCDKTSNFFKKSKKKLNNP